MSNHYQPGEYGIVHKYYNQDTLERKPKNLNETYEQIIDDKEISLDSIKLDKTNKKDRNDLTIDINKVAAGSSKESEAKIQSNIKSKKTIAAEAGFSVRNLVQKETSDTFIQINSANSPDSAFSGNLKEEDSRSHLKISIDANETRKNSNFSSIRKANTLSRPERQLTTRRRNFMRENYELPPMARTGATKSERANVDNPIIQEKSDSIWVKISKCCTCCIFSACLKLGGMTDKNVIQAWREK
ncbi:hypothetical protein BCR36DRAFT_250291, partial [Piromyces finnis]